MVASPSKPARWTPLLVLLLVLGVACRADPAGADGGADGGGGGPPVDGGSNAGGASRDGSLADGGGGGGWDPGRRRPGATVACGDEDCVPPQICCFEAKVTGGASTRCADACEPEESAAACDEVDDCADRGSSCCLILNTKEGTFPQCPPAASYQGCTSSCRSHIVTTCGDFTSLRFCKRHADCVGDVDGFNYCCSIYAQGGALQVCTNFDLALSTGCEIER